MHDTYKKHSSLLFLFLGIVLILGLLLLVRGENKDKIVSYILTPATTKKDELPKKPLEEYVEIINSCGPYFDGDGGCVNVRTKPSVDSAVVTRLRNGIVLKVDKKVEVGGETWYKVVFDEWLRYGDRVSKDWYIAGSYVKPFMDVGVEELGNKTIATNTKYILIDRSEQKLYAYDGDSLFMETSVSTGLNTTPTPRGEFHIYRKTPSRYMQGPIPGISIKEYDLPGVPWNLYFTQEGAVIHGAYWHDHFGKQWSNGCVNLSPEIAKKLYTWSELGMKVVVRD